MREDIVCFNLPETSQPFYVSLAGTSYCDGSYHIKRKHSKCTVIEYVKEGTGIVSDGVMRERVDAGKIYILRQGRDHDYCSDPRDPWVKIFINVRGALAEYLLSSYGITDDLVLDGEGMECYFHRMMEAAFDKSLEDDEKSARIAVIFHELVISLWQKRKTCEHVDPEMQVLRRYIAENSHRIVGNRELAAVIHRCEDHCVKHFKKAFGKTPYEYQIDEKLSSAKLMLKNTNLPICEIAERLGYCDQHYFSNLFKKKCDMSPSQYRNGVR